MELLYIKCCRASHTGDATRVPDPCRLAVVVVVAGAAAVVDDGGDVLIV